MEDSLDNVKERKTALAFLCLMNAEYREIERFLVTYPDALLFGSNENDLEKGVLNDMHRCQCFNRECKINRENALKVVRRGFQFYRGIRLLNVSGCDLFQNFGKTDWETN
jgi:hypothetical protein